MTISYHPTLSCPEITSLLVNARVAIEYPERTLELCEDDPDLFDIHRPVAKQISVEIDNDLQESMDWAEYQGTKNFRMGCEGAWFINLGFMTEIIGCRGGQFLHHDQHLIEHSKDNPDLPMSEHTWNLIVTDSDQMLVCENGPNMFEHFSLTRGNFIYFNNFHRHMVTRKDPLDTAIMVQICGFNENQGEEALTALKAVLQAKPESFNN